MAMSREEFVSRIKAHLGDATDDASISFMEDMVDTYDELSSTDWEQKYRENDAAWRKRYIERFENGGVKEEETRVEVDTVEDNSEDDSATEITFDDILYGEG